MKKITIEELKIIDKWWGAIQNVQNRNRNISEWTQFKFACLDDLKDAKENTINNKPEFYL